MWLSNLEADPGEKRNVAGQERERVRQMLQKIRGWEKYVGIPGRPWLSRESPRASSVGWLEPFGISPLTRDRGSARGGALAQDLVF